MNFFFRIEGWCFKNNFTIFNKKKGHSSDLIFLKKNSTKQQFFYNKKKSQKSCQEKVSLKRCHDSDFLICKCCNCSDFFLKKSFSEIFIKTCNAIFILIKIKKEKSPTFNTIFFKK